MSAKPSMSYASRLGLELGYLGSQIGPFGDACRVVMHHSDGDRLEPIIVEAPTEAAAIAGLCAALRELKKGRAR